MTQTVNMLTLRKNIGSVLDRTYYQKQRYLIKRKNQNMAVLIPVEDYNLYFKDQEKIEDYTDTRIKEFMRNDVISKDLRKKLKKISANA